MLRKYVLDSSHILQDQSHKIQENLTDEEKRLRILDRKEHVVWTKVISMVKILWNNHGIKKPLWGQNSNKEVVVVRAWSRTTTAMKALR